MYNDFMNYKTKWVWEIYLFLILLFIYHKINNLLNPTSPIHLYYFILVSFNKHFLLTYFLFSSQVLLNIIHIIPLAAYTYRVKLFNPKFWQILLFMRLIFDISGHSYEVNHLVSMYHSKPWFAFIVLAQSITTYIPSYFACYTYAFRQEKIIPSR